MPSRPAAIVAPSSFLRSRDVLFSVTELLLSQGLRQREEAAFGHAECGEAPMLQYPIWPPRPRLSERTDAVYYLVYRAFLLFSLYPDFARRQAEIAGLVCRSSRLRLSAAA